MGAVAVTYLLVAWVALLALDALLGITQLRKRRIDDVKRRLLSDEYAAEVGKVVWVKR